MILPDETYDLLKKLLTLWLPAFGTFIFTINKIWGLGLPSEEIVATISALCTFLGVIFNIENANYYKKIEEAENTIDPEQ